MKAARIIASLALLPSAVVTARAPAAKPAAAPIARPAALPAQYSADTTPIRITIACIGA